jgi:hypothetical protein
MRDPCRPIRYTSRPPVTPSPTFLLLSSILGHEWRRFTSDYHHRRCLSFPFLAPIKWSWAPPLGLHYTSRALLPLLPLLLRALTILKPSLPPTSPSHRCPLTRDPWNGFLASPLVPNLLVARPDEPQCRLDRTSMRSCALPQPLVHDKPPHVQSTELWTRSTPIFVRKINTSKPVSHHFSERPSSFLKINPRHLIS